MPSRRNLLKTLIAGPFALGWRRLLGAPLDDAAPAYRRVFAMMPEWKEDDYDTLREAAKVPLGAKVKEIVHRSETLLDAFRVATQGDICTWKPVRSNDDLGQDQLDFRKTYIGRAAILRARLRFAAKQDGEALDDVFAAARFGRHIGLSGVMIGVLFGLAPENQAIIVLGAALPGLNNAIRTDIRRRVDELPASASWNVILCEESEYIMSHLRSHYAKTGWPKTADDLGDSEEVGKRVHALTKGERTKTLAMLDDIGPRMRGLEADLKLPYRQCMKNIAERADQLQKANPWVSSVMPNLIATKWSTDRTAMLWLMLRAAILRLNGDKAGFAAVRDPGGDGPFACTEREGGFLLESALQEKDHMAIALSIGRADEKAPTRD